MRIMNDLTSLPNIGATVAAQLHEAGIHTIEALREAGSREAWLRIFAFDPSACYNRLLGLEGAIRGVRYRELDSETKDALKAFYRQHRPGKE